ncbi:MAG: hypothetical protein JRH11_22550, partial [Deltaproteobacteria bacterium]|nr:hypothetical protein [Deltaproteobacteria bacterium]
GWHASAPALLDGSLSLYTEVNAMKREDTNTELTQERRWGRAIYASAQISTGNTSILAQWKDYENYILQPFGNIEVFRVYSAAPSLDLDSERYRGQENSRGGQLEITYAFNPSPWALTFVGIGYGHVDEHEVDPWDGIFTGHGLLTLSRQNDSVTDQEIGWTLDLAGGYRREVYLDDDASQVANAGELDWEVVHALFDMNIGYGAHSFELRADPRYEQRRTALGGVRDYWRGGTYLTWSFAGRIHVSATLQWNSEKVTRSTFYPGAEAKWEFVRGSHVRFFVGQTPGGLLCSGGVCRDVPEFEGGVLELVLRI